MPFRDDLSALEARRDNLARELSEIQERKRELDGLEQREKQVERALQDTTSALAGMPGSYAARSRAALPLLDRVQIASPCEAAWDQMEGNGRVRFCLECEKNVYNLSAMPREEAEELLRSRGDVCVRLYRRTDGTVLTSDCPVGMRIRRAKNRKYALIAIGGGLLASVGATFALRTQCTLGVSATSQGAIASPMGVDPVPPRAVMGEMPAHVFGVENLPKKADVPDAPAKGARPDVKKRPPIHRSMGLRVPSPDSSDL